MVFISMASTSSWEPFHRAIAVVCFMRPWLVEKQKELLDVIRWAPLPGPDVQFAQARSCSKNKGILGKNGREKPSEHNIYVDDDLMGDIPRRMPLAIASAAEAISTVMGVPMLLLRQSAVAMAKWRQLIIAHQLILLVFYSILGK